MTRSRTLFWLAFSGFFPLIYAFLRLDDRRLQGAIIASALVSYLGFLLTRWLIPIVAASTLKAGIYGKDINKKGTEAGEKRVPEALGLAVGVAYLLCLALFEFLHVMDASGWNLFADDDPTDWILDYNAALATICFMLFLGFVDDVLDIAWRVKLALPTVAALPLLASYSGGTGISVPKPLRHLLGSFLELGAVYKVYMIMLTIFSTNAVNILAGVNGLEAGQTFLVACAVCVHNLFEIVLHAGSSAVVDGHLFSLFLMLPLATTTFALLGFNWYPSKVFVGDTFTYFAGMTIAVAGILGHFSETLLIFLMPQVFNFVYSVPQLFHWVPCPRHRLPTYVPEEGVLKPTKNWNLVNLVLEVLGPCGEEQLCVRILCMQYLSCCFAFVLRWCLAGWYK